MPNAISSASRCGFGKPGSLSSIGAHSWCNAANGSSISDCTPAIRARRHPEACRERCSSNAVLPTPGSPDTTIARLSPARTASTSRSSLPQSPCQSISFIARPAPGPPASARRWRQPNAQANTLARSARPQVEKILTAQPSDDVAIRRGAGDADGGYGESGSAEPRCETTAMTEEPLVRGSDKERERAENRWGATQPTPPEKSERGVETREFAKCVVFNAGTSRYVLTTDVSVNEGQAFIRDLVLVIGWFTPLYRYGR